MADPSPARLPRAAFAAQGFAALSPLSVLLFRREEIATRLNLLEPVVSESLVIGLFAMFVALGIPRWRNRLPAGASLFVGGILAIVGLYFMAWTIEPSYYIAGGVLYATGAATALVLPRVVLSAQAGADERLTVLSTQWAAMAGGLAWPLVAEIFFDLADTTVLWWSMAAMIIATLLAGAVALDHDDDIVSEPIARRLDTPWARRSIAAWFGLGAVVATADDSLTLLVDEWQRSPTQVAALLGAGPIAALLALTAGRWYHRLHSLTGSQRADAIGIQLAAAGTLVAIGALSFTYIGLIVGWLLAGAALGLALASLDSAAFTSVAPGLRRPLAARQVAALGSGAGATMLLNSQVIGGWSEQWKVALPALPLIAFGFLVRRFADPAHSTAASAAEARAAIVPRRVAGGDGTPTPLLSVEALDVAYGSVQVLFGVDLCVEEGEVVGLLGTNGGGKTTLLRAISGLEPTIGGRVVYAGLDVTKTRPTWRVAMGLHQVVGGEAVVGPLTVEENLRLFTHLVPADRREAGIDEAMDLFPRLRERRTQRAETLSGGEKQMLALSKAIIVQPRLLLIDEFSLGLAPLVVAELLPVVREIAERGSSVLLVEQSVNVGLSIADRAYVMDRGTIGFEGDAAELRDRPELLQAAYLEGITHALEQR